MSPWQVIDGDCLDVLATLAEASVDAVVTDPPYGLSPDGKARTWDDIEGARARGGFMGHAWDAAVPGVTWARAVLRVLKPGGHILAFGGTRTYHRLACALEDAGFEIRDSLHWMFGSGFPKSMDVSRAIDVAKGAERETVGTRVYAGDHVQRSSDGKLAPPIGTFVRVQDDRIVTAPATPETAAWQGWGTALKPGHEPCVLARKPLVGTVAANVLEHGTGALNVDGCRLTGDGASPSVERRASASAPPRVDGGLWPSGGNGEAWLAPHAGEELGRWPANVLLDEEAAAELDAQTGDLTSGANPTTRGAPRFRSVYGKFQGQTECTPARGADVGGASRFFYVAKPDRAERDAGLHAFAPRSGGEMTGRDDGSAGTQSPRAGAGRNGGARNVHPTVKPIDLMRWLVRLVTPPNGLVLDPFAGAGTTGIAAVLDGFRFVGIEREAEFAVIARARIAHWERSMAPSAERAAEIDAIAAPPADGVQLGLFGSAP